MPGIDQTLFVQVVNFIVLAILLNVFVYRPVRGILTRRREKIESFERIYDEFNRKANDFSNEIESKMSETVNQGLRYQEDMKNEAHHAERTLVQEAYSRLDEKIANAKENIQEMIIQSRTSLQSEMDLFSKELVEKILERGIR